MYTTSTAFLEALTEAGVSYIFANLGSDHPAILEAIRKSAGAPQSGEKRWPPRYAARRMAWHLLDHAWEIEDRST